MRKRRKGVGGWVEEEGVVRRMGGCSVVPLCLREEGRLDSFSVTGGERGGTLSLWPPGALRRRRKRPQKNNEEEEEGVATTTIPRSTQLRVPTRPYLSRAEFNQKFRTLLECGRVLCRSPSLSLERRAVKNCSVIRFSCSVVFEGATS